MYPVSASVTALFDANQRQLLRITGTDKNGAAVSITDDDVMEGSFSVDRYCWNSERIEVGTAVASELSMRLDNYSGKFTGIIFEGSELTVEIGIADWRLANPTTTWIPIGVFIPDVQPRNRTIIEVSALDRMMLLDSVTVAEDAWTNEAGENITDENGAVMYFYSELVFPCTVESLINQVCDACHIQLAEIVSSLPNAQYLIQTLPSTGSGTSYRNLIQWCAGLMGCNAFMDWNGQLRFNYYNAASTGYISTPDRRYASDMFENDIAVTGISYRDLDNNLYMSGRDEYLVDVSDNAFISPSNASAVLPGIYAAMQGFSYRPFTASVKPAPWLYPMDSISYVDADGTAHVTVISNVNITINGHTEISGTGETTQATSYGNPNNGLTAQQQRAFNQLRQLTGTQLEAAVGSATEQITGAKDSHIRFIYDENGGLEEIVIMDTDDINTAVKVWRWNSGGLGYSSTGYDGPYGLAMTQDGSIVADFINTGVLNADLLKTGIISDLAGKNYWNLNTGAISIKLDPGETGAVTPADLDRVENNAQTWANAAEANAKAYTDSELSGYASQEYVSAAIELNNESLDIKYAGEFAAKGDTVTQTQKWYYKSTSPTQLFGGTWSTSSPTWENGYYIWSKTLYFKGDGTYTESPAVCDTGNTGAKGEAGDDARYLYITADKSTATAKGVPQTVTLTACVGQGDVEDIDPTGTILEYAWFKSEDGSSEYYYASTKNLTITIDGDFCDNVASLRFCLVDDETFFRLTDENDNPIQTEDGDYLEVN